MTITMRIEVPYDNEIQFFDACVGAATILKDHQ